MQGRAGAGHLGRVSSALQITKPAVTELRRGCEARLGLETSALALLRRRSSFGAGPVLLLRTTAFIREARGEVCAPCRARLSGLLGFTGSSNSNLGWGRLSRGFVRPSREAPFSSGKRGT